MIRARKFNLLLRVSIDYALGCGDGMEMATFGWPVTLREGGGFNLMYVYSKREREREREREKEVEGEGW